MVNKIKITRGERWFHNKWRPAIAWQYFIVNIFDFIIGPYAHTIITSLIFGIDTVSQQWQPLTLQGGGVYHIAMLTIIGATSWQRTNEKIQMMKNGIQNPEPDVVDDLPPNNEGYEKEEEKEETSK